MSHDRIRRRTDTQKKVSLRVHFQLLLLFSPTQPFCPVALSQGTRSIATITHHHRLVSRGVVDDSFGCVVGSGGMNANENTRVCYLCVGK